MKIHIYKLSNYTPQHIFPISNYQNVQPTFCITAHTLTCMLRFFNKNFFLRIRLISQFSVLILYGSANAFMSIFFKYKF